MYRLKSIAKLLLFVSVVAGSFMSCSDDDKEIPAPKPSRVVKQVMIYKSADESKLMSRIIFNYDKDYRLTQVYCKSPLSVVNYVYSDESKVTYSYSSESTTLVEMSTTLESGRAYSCSFSNKDTDAAYLYNDGYLKTSKYNNVELKYTWEGGNLKSITSSPGTLYNNQFNASTVSNDYSLDLNTLAQLIDGRADYLFTMNTYAQMAGILGGKSKDIIESTNYMYDYSFYQDGRLKMMTLIASGEAYTFRLEYEDNILE